MATFTMTDGLGLALVMSAESNQGLGFLDGADVEIGTNLYDDGSAAIFEIAGAGAANFVEIWYINDNDGGRPYDLIEDMYFYFDLDDDGFVFPDGELLLLSMVGIDQTGGNGSLSEVDWEGASFTNQDDFFYATSYDDVIYGGPGDDYIESYAGFDILEGGIGDDILQGGLGGDFLAGGDGDDILEGGADDDEFFGDEGDDTLVGGDGNDYLEGGDGDDVVTGGAGNDILWTSGNGTHDFDGGSGQDFIAYGHNNGSARSEDISVKLNGGNYASVFLDGAPVDIIRNVEHVASGNGQDRLFGDGAVNFLAGLKGNDRLDGGGGNDELQGGVGADVVTGGDGNDLLFGENTGGFETSFDSAVIPSSGQTMAISLTLPDSANGATIEASGIVSRTPVTSPNLNIAFVIDASGSTSSPFNGSVNVGDVNGDGLSNTRLDAEILGFEHLVKAITKNVDADNVNFTIISFDSGAKTHLTAKATLDANGNGVADIVDTLKAFRPGTGTNFEAGLQQAVKALSGATDGQNMVFFLSDGFNNEGGSFADEVTKLRDSSGINATIRAFGVGGDASEDQLDLVDDGVDNDSAKIVLDPSKLGSVLIDPGIKKAEILRVELLVNGQVVKTIPGSALQSTPLGLNYAFDLTLTGLKPTADDVVVARVIAKDPAQTTIETEQIVESLAHLTGNDTLSGNAGHDRILAGAGVDTLNGDAGNDYLDGGVGKDTMRGGPGNDVYVVETAGDKVVDVGGGLDTIISSINLTLQATIENLTLAGSAVTGIGNNAANTIIGNDLANVLAGNAGNDNLHGDAGNDGLSGGIGADKVFGDAGRDTLTGGLGADDLYAGLDNVRDTFIFAKGDSGKTAATWDQVFQFDRSLNASDTTSDKIDLRPIDGDPAAGDQGLRFVTAFTTATGSRPDGQVRVVDAGPHVNVLIDIDGNNTVDMILQVMNIASLSSRDFFL